MSINRHRPHPPYRLIGVLRGRGPRGHGPPQSPKRGGQSIIWPPPKWQDQKILVKLITRQWLRWCLWNCELCHMSFFEIQNSTKIGYRLHTKVSTSRDSILPIFHGTLGWGVNSKPCSPLAGAWSSMREPPTTSFSCQCQKCNTPPLYQHSWKGGKDTIWPLLKLQKFERLWREIHALWCDMKISKSTDGWSKIGSRKSYRK